MNREKAYYAMYSVTNIILFFHLGAILTFKMVSLPIVPFKLHINPADWHIKSNCRFLSNLPLRSWAVEKWEKMTSWKIKELPSSQNSKSMAFKDKKDTEWVADMASYVTEDSRWPMKGGHWATLWISWDQVTYPVLRAPLCIPNLTLGQANREIQESIQEPNSLVFPLSPASFELCDLEIVTWHSLKICFPQGKSERWWQITNLMNFLQSLCNMTCSKRFSVPCRTH